MDFDFSWELKLFQIFENWKKRRDQKKKEQETIPLAKSYFRDLEGKLVMIARALCKQNIQIGVGTDLGGVHGGFFIVPELISLHTIPEINEEAWKYRIWFMSQVYLKQYFLKGDESPLEVFLETCYRIRSILMEYKIHSPNAYLRLQEICDIEFGSRVADFDLSRGEQILRWACGLNFSLEEEFWKQKDLPRFSTLLENVKLEQLPNPLSIFGRLLTDSKEIAASPEIGKTREEEEQNDEEEDEITSEIDAPAMDGIDSVEFSEQDQEDTVLLHNFEKVECLDDYNGLARDFDGSDEMDDHEEAMQELELRQLIRTQEKVHSIYRADLRMNTEIGDVEENTKGGIPYPEWNQKKRRYKLNWCKVFEQRVTGNDHLQYSQRIKSEHAKEIQKLTRELEKFRSLRAPLNRQTEGEQVDLDAVVDNQAMLLSKKTPSERVYIRKVKNHRDVATLILLDLSLSSDSYVDGRSILDICKESLVILGTSLEKFDEKVEIAGFHSHTRNSCNYFIFKTVEESWNDFFRKLPNISTDGYTRIGPPLRHATTRLSQMEAKKKCILLMSDGKPNDYDQYEGFYGIYDIRQAIREAVQKKIEVYGLALTDTAYDYLPAMLGRQKYSILKDPKQVSPALIKLYEKLHQ